MPSIKEIWIHPVKALGGIPVDEAEIDEYGLKYDRQYMICEPDVKSDDPTKNYKFITQRQDPRLVLVQTSINMTKNELKLYHAPTDSTLILPLEIPADVYDYGPRINAHIWGKNPESIDLGEVYPVAEFFDKVRETKDSKVTIVACLDRRTANRGAPKDAGRISQVSFQDYFPSSIINDLSLADLNERVGQKTNNEVVLSSRNFRPNFVITGTEKAWDEDDWKKIRINGKYNWYIPARNIRCQVTTVNVAKGQFEPTREPFKTMMSFRRIDPGDKYGCCFGMNGVNEEYGYKVRVGDSFEILERGEHFYPKKDPGHE